jgi:two-component system sensor histidine kinase BarA
MLWGIFYGGLPLLILQHLNQFRQTKQRDHLSFACFTLTLLLWRLIWGGHASLFSSEFLEAFFNAYKALSMVIFVLFSGVFSLYFIDSFQQKYKTTPYLLVSMAVVACLGFLYLFNLIPSAWFSDIVLYANLLVMLLSLVAAIEARKKGLRSANYLIAGWIIFWIGTILITLIIFSFIPYHVITTYSFPVSALIQALLFSIALNNKTRDEYLLEINEANQELNDNMELIEEQNVRLDLARKEALATSLVKSDFLATMSHEIRTPLNAIIGFSSQLLRHDIKRPFQEKLSLIHTSANTLLDVVNDVLDLSKLEAGKAQVKYVAFDSQSLFEDTVSIFSQAAQNKGLSFIYEITPLPKILIGDSQKLKQILNNLLSNAVKFTHKGHIALRISAETTEEGQLSLYLEIEDTGIGISKADRKKLFNSFVQLEKTPENNQQGTGLGLVICQKLVNLMQGSMNFSSVPNEGSCFKVTLPLQQGLSPILFKDSPFWKEKDVLIYDPNTLNLQSHQKLLSQLGANVTIVDNLVSLNKVQKTDVLFFALAPNAWSRGSAIYRRISAVEAPIKIALCEHQCPDSALLETYQFQHCIRVPLTLGKLDKTFNLNDYNLEANEISVPDLSELSILAVDDTPSNLILLSSWLDGTQAKVTLAHSARQALSYCKQKSFDLILMDVNMPEMDGVTASQQIRELDSHIGTPIVAVTAHALKEEQERLLASGLDDYLPKPILYDDLIAIIIRWCELPTTSSNTVSWQLALQKANNNKHHALAMLEALLKEIPKYARLIDQYWREGKLEQLTTQVHKLHGACCYTGVPKLQNLCLGLETRLKQNQVTDFQVEQVLTEIKQVSPVIQALLAQPPDDTA